MDARLFPLLPFDLSSENLWWSHSRSICHTLLQESTENSGTHRKGAILGHLMFKVTFKTLLASFDIMKITLFDEQHISSSQQLQRKMATDAFFFFLPGGLGEAGLLLFPSPESFAKFPGPRLWEEIPFPSMVRKYPCRAWNTFPGLIKKKSFSGNAQNFPLPAIVFFQDQTGKISRKSWKPVSIFYSVEASHHRNCKF